MRDAERGSLPFDLVDDLLDRADQHEWRVGNDLSGQREAVGELVGRWRVGADVGELHERRSLDVAMSIARSGIQPPTPLGQLSEREPGARRRAAIVVGQPGELEDVGVPAGERDDTAAVTADQDRNVFLNRSDAERCDVHSLVVAVDVDRPVVEE